MTFKRTISMVLLMALLLGLGIPMGVQATELEVTTEAAETTVPVTEETVSVTEETVPATEETVPVTEETVPVTEETVPVTEETVSATEETVPVTEETVPATEETVPAETEVVEETIAQEAQGAVTAVAGCVIDPANKSKVTVTVQITVDGATDDGQLYLFAVPTYVDSVAGQNPLAAVTYTGPGSYSFTVDLNNGTANSLLYSKFYVGVRTGGQFAAASCGNFITNPEVLASSKAARTKTASKKGIHINFATPTDLEELGIKNCFFNIEFEDILSNSATEYAYNYNGKTYYFNPAYINNYDSLISYMTKAGMSITVALQNPYRAGFEYLIHPGVGQNPGAVYYALNTSTQQGLETVAAAAHFLAERYNGANAKGKVDNWILGNEVNDNKQYYYMGQQNIETFVQEYLQSFRVIYTAVKSAYANANVYFCLEHRWNTPNSAVDYAAKQFVDLFSAYTKAQGDMDWGLAFHPYSFPMNDADILNDGQATIDENGAATYGGEVTDDVNTLYITMKNIDILTNYFHSEHLLNPAGQVRSILLSEQGYTSYSNITGNNEQKQAANIALAYYKAQMNPDVDVFMLRTHTDEFEGSPYYKFGLWEGSADMRPTKQKYAYQVYKHIDTKESLKYTEFAKAQLGISDWSQVVPNWNPGAFNSMGSRLETQLNSYTSASGTKDIVAKMLNEWEVGYNVFDIVTMGYVKPFPDGVAVANPYAYYREKQSVKKKFSTPVSVSKYLIMDLGFDAKDASGAGDQLKVTVRLRSGNDVMDGVAVLGVNQRYQLCMDLSSWSGRNSISAIELLIQEDGQQKSFDGTFYIYNVKSADKVAGLPEPPTTTPMYRLYNPNSGEHFYTGSVDERNTLTAAGWQYEGIAWNAPIAGGNPVYRMYNPNSGDHHYTTSVEEKDMLVGVGWQYEGVCWNSMGNVALHRLYNPNADCGSHHYTGSIEERDFLVSVGWIYEGIGWYGLLN